jgi:hypothetical protein
MSRSTYIYLVWDINEEDPLGAFTVKHEAQGFIRRRTAADLGPSLDDITVDTYRHSQLHATVRGANFMGEA